MISKSRVALTGLLIIPFILVATVYWFFKHHSYFAQTVEARLNEAFVEYVESTQKDPILPVAEIQQTETFQLGSTPISASANFKYFLDLKKPWKVRTEDKKVVVLTPAIEFSSSAAKGDIPAEALNQRASENKSSILEAARKEVSNFLKTWLKTEFPKESDFDIQVDFQ